MKLFKKLSALALTLTLFASCVSAVSAKAAGTQPRPHVVFRKIDRFEEVGEVADETEETPDITEKISEEDNLSEDEKEESRVEEENNSETE